MRNISLSLLLHWATGMGLPVKHRKKNDKQRQFNRGLGVAVAGSFGLLLATASIATMLADAWDDGLLAAGWQWSVLIATIAVGWTGFQLSRLWFGWQQQSLIRAKDFKKRTPHEKAILKRGFLELFLYFTASLVALVLMAFASASNASAKNLLRLSADAAGDQLTGLNDLAIFLGLFALAFAPLLVAFLIKARADARDRNQPLLRSDVVSPTALLIIGLGGGLVAALTWAASVKLIASSSDFGAIITSLVILLFLVVIIAPHVARQLNRSDEASAEIRASAHKQSILPWSPTATISRVDSILVRIVSPLSGATQHGWGPPYILLCTTMFLLCALGYAMPSPFGLVPIGVAMIISISLGRRWAWLEEDRETASRLQTTRSHDIYVGFDNDLKDEALLGYAWLFVLVPLALNQIQDWTHSFHLVPGTSSGNSFLDWLRFFGVEIAKAVPFVDVWETYNGEVAAPFDTIEPLAKHLTVAARFLVNLVIVSALIQALGIWQRARTQNRLYDSGQIDHFDPFTEAEFFDRGVRSRGEQPGEPKKRFRDRIQRHVENRRALGHSPLPYNERRLAELIESDIADVRDGAAWMISRYGVLAGPPREQLRQLNNRWDLFKLPQIAALNRPQDKDFIVEEKLKFERVLAALKQDASTLDDEDIGKLLRLLADVRGSPDFVYGRTLAYELLGRLSSTASVIALSLHVLDGAHYDAKPTWRARNSAFGGLPHPLNLNLGRADERMRIYDALGELGGNKRADEQARILALELLEWMGSIEGGDRAIPSRQRASECAISVKRAIGSDSI